MKKIKRNKRDLLTRFEDMLEVKNLQAHYTYEDGEKTEILKGVDFEVKPGEVHVILGPNGSGKSTFGRVLLGDPKYEVSEGDVKFSGEDFLEMEADERARAGFFLSFQSPPEVDGVSVREFLFAAKKSQDPEFSSSFRFKKGLEKSLENLRLGKEFSDREIHKGCSGGERKKIEMASLLQLNSKLAFLDEIDSGVDIDTIRAIGRGIAEFLEDKSKALVLVTHSEKLLAEIEPTHVHVFCGGKVVRSGGPEMIQQVHQDGFDAFLGEKKSGGLPVI